MQFQLEKIAESKEGWTQVEQAVTPIAKDPVVDRTQIVITIAKGNQLSKWFNDMREKFDMQIVSRMSDNNDVWLVSYDYKENNPETVLAYLNADPVIASAKYRTLAPEN